MAEQIANVMLLAARVLPVNSTNALDTVNVTQRIGKQVAADAVVWLQAALRSVPIEGAHQRPCVLQLAGQATWQHRPRKG